MEAVEADNAHEVFDTKSAGYDDTKDVEEIDTTEAPCEDTKDVDEELDTKCNNNSKEKTC